MANTRRIAGPAPRARLPAGSPLPDTPALGLACLLLALATFIFVAAPIDGVRDRLAQDIKARTGRDFAVAGPTSLSLLPRLAVSFADVSLSAAARHGRRADPAREDRAGRGGLSCRSSRSSPPSGASCLAAGHRAAGDAQGRRSWEFRAHSKIGGCGWRRPAGLAPCHRGRSARRRHSMQRSSRQPSKSCCRPASASSTARCATSTSARACATRSDRSSSILSPTISAGRSRPKAASPGAARAWRCRRPWRPIRGLLEDQKARLTFKLSGRPGRGQLRRGARGCLRAGARRACGHQGAFAARPANWAGGGMGSGSQDPDAFSLSSCACRRRRPPVAVAPDGEPRGHLARRRAHHRDQGCASPPRRQSATVGARPCPHPDPSRASVGASGAPGSRAIRSMTFCGATRRRRKLPQPGRASQKRAGAGRDWSDERLDFSPLGLADADLALSVERLVHRDVKTGPSRISLKLKDKVADLTLEEMQLYDGRGRGVLTARWERRGAGRRRQPDARWRLRPTAAQGRARLRLARRAQHHRLGACRPGRLRAADGGDLERQGGDGDRQRRHRRHRRRPDAAQHRAGPLRRAQRRAGRQDGLQRVCRHVCRRQRRCQQPGPAAGEQ